MGVPWLQYDVSFVDGTCSEVFTGCNNTSEDLTFHSLVAAEQAATALWQQVFRGTRSSGFVVVPYKIFKQDYTILYSGVGLSYENEWHKEIIDDQGNWVWNNQFDYRLDDRAEGQKDGGTQHFARFTPVPIEQELPAASVPEAPSIVLLAVGSLILLAGRRRVRNECQRGHIWSTPHYKKKLPHG